MVRDLPSLIKYIYVESSRYENSRLPAPIPAPVSNLEPSLVDHHAESKATAKITHIVSTMPTQIANQRAKCPSGPLIVQGGALEIEAQRPQPRTKPASCRCRGASI